MGHLPSIHAETPRHARGDVPLLFAVFLAAFVPYWLTLHPTFHTFDVAEFAAGAWDLGIVHNPGYPTYLLLAHAFQAVVPIGDPAYRLNLLSALTAAGTVSALALLALRLTRSRSAAVVAALAFGYSYWQWSEAVIATPYTLNTQLLASEFALLLHWRRTLAARSLYAFGLLYGLQFGVHASAVLQAPAWLLLLASRHAWFRRHPWHLLPTGLLAALGLSTYAYLPIRYLAQPRLDYARALGLDLTRPSDLWAMVSGDAFRYAMLAFGPQELLSRVARFGANLAENWLGIGVVIGLYGVWRLVRESRPVGAATALLFLVHVGFYVDYDVPNSDTMFLPAYLVWGVWVAVGLQALIPSWLAALRSSADWRDTAERDLRLMLAGAVATFLVLNYPRVDASQDVTARTYADVIMASLPPGALVLGTWLDITPLHYAQIVEGARPDVTLFDVGLYGLGRASALRRAGVLDSGDLITDELVGRIQVDLQRRPVIALGTSDVLAEHFTLTPTGGAYLVTLPPGG